jgi:hypothetical protein
MNMDRRGESMRGSRVDLWIAGRRVLQRRGRDGEPAGASPERLIIPLAWALCQVGLNGRNLHPIGIQCVILS